ncbi:MAG: redoxin domain-containing protein [Bacteroidota bacterium]
MLKSLFILLLLIPSSVFAQTELNAPAPNFQLPERVNYTINKELRLSDFKGKFVVLDFWATWCQPCVEGIPELNAMVQEYRKEDLVLLSITDESNERVTNFLEKFPVQYQVLRDDAKTLFELYAIQARPTYLVIDPMGKLIYRGNEMDRSIMAELLATGTLAEKPVPTDSGVAPQDSFSLPYVNFNGGQNPVYNAMRMLLGKSETQYEMIHQFVIRPSLEKEFGGSAEASNGNMVGITYSGGKIDELLAFVKQLPSLLRIENRTSLNGRYDIIYRKKSKGKKYAFVEIEQTLLDGLGVHLDSTLTTVNAKAIQISQMNKEILALAAMPKGAMNAYFPLDLVAKLLEQKANQIVVVADDLKGKYIPQKGLLGYNALYRAKASEITDYLAIHGIQVQNTPKEVWLYSIKEN